MQLLKKGQSSSSAAAEAFEMHRPRYIVIVRSLCTAQPEVPEKELTLAHPIQDSCIAFCGLSIYLARLTVTVAYRCLAPVETL